MTHALVDAGERVIVLDDLRTGFDWAVPGGYTVVDPYLLVFYQWGQRIGLEMRGLYPAWTRLAKRIVARPAVKRVLENEAIKIF